MTTPRRSVLFLTLAFTLASATSVTQAQGWMTPATAAVQSAAASVAVQRPDGTVSSMPISLDLLPYGTQQLGASTYMISNYEGTGNTVMIYAASPLRIATYGEMVTFQAQFAAAMRQLSQAPVVSAVPASQVTAPVSPAPVSPVAASFPASAPLPQVQAPPVMPVATALSVPASAFAPTSPIVWTSAVTQSQPAPAMPAPMLPVPALPAPAQPAPLPAPSMPTVVAPQPRDAEKPTTLPEFMKGNFNGRVLKDGSIQITYSLVNRSRATTAKLDPQDLRLSQGGSSLAARLDARDSSGEPTMIPPSSGEIGTITLRNVTSPGTPVTLEWLVRDLSNNLTYPVRYHFTPSTTTASLQPGN